MREQERVVARGAAHARLELRLPEVVRVDLVPDRHVVDRGVARQRVTRTRKLRALGGVPRSLARRPGPSARSASGTCRRRRGHRHESVRVSLELPRRQVSGTRSAPIPRSRSPVVAAIGCPSSSAGRRRSRRRGRSPPGRQAAERAQPGSCRGGAARPYRQISVAHEPLARRADERDGLGEEHPHRVAKGDRLLLDRARTSIWERAQPVSSTAVLSVSVANCSRCASWTVSACCSANSRRPRKRSWVAPERKAEAPSSHGPRSSNAGRCQRRVSVLPFDSVMTIRATLAALVLFLGLAGLGAARPSAPIEIPDPVGDAGCCVPDISQVQISNDARGILTVAVKIANRPQLLAGDFVGVYVDPSRTSPATATPSGSSSTGATCGSGSRATTTGTRRHP